MASPFHITATCPQTAARTGILDTPHGQVSTPAFMAVGSQATVKTLTPEELRTVGATIILGNAYHLYLRPGLEVVERAGGLHRFMGWDGPILTDSGGFQVFSLAPLRRLSDEGVLFRSHIDGSEHFLTPERDIEIQERLGADIIMALDECAPAEASPVEIERALARTNRWAERCRAAQSAQGGDQLLFAIVQGGTDPRLRRQAAAFLSGLDFPGYALGGLSVGEPKATTWEVVAATVPHLPPDRPRYLMGMGAPEDLFEGVARGIDMFDCALPTRVARHGGLFTRQGRRSIFNSSFRDELGPIEASCDCYTCAHFSTAYLRHLFKSQELLGLRLATIHNLRFFLRLMEEMRQAIGAGDFARFAESFLGQYRPSDEGTRLEQRRRWQPAARRKGPP